MKLSGIFYERDSATVAEDLLGKILFHRTEEGLTSGRIVETEAYFGVDDPASRASKKKTKINKTMWNKPGTSLVYMVHANWLFNVISEGEGVPGGVLIRALEPLEGLDVMRRRRNMEKEKDLASGPGKLTQALGINKDHHRLYLPDCEDLSIEKHEDIDFEVAKSHRIGVTEDLERKLRFFVKGSGHVSR